MDNLFGLFVKVAQNNRDVAIESPMQYISYEKLLQLSHIYYQYLTTIPTQRIAIHCDALLTVEMIAMMFAIFAHKKSCVLLDAARGEEFNQKILSQIDCKKVVNQKDLLDIKKNQSTISLCANIEQPINPKDEGYVVTTSGSTGEPKIILGSHAGLVHFICWQKKRYFNEVKYRVAHTTNCAFDVIYREIFTTLISGSTLVIPNIDLKYQSGECLTKWLKTKQISVLYGVPSVFDFWLNTMRLGQSKLPLAKVFFAGEKLQKSTVYHLQQYFVVDCLVNLYGPSETTLAKFYYDRDLAQIENYDAIPVGRALPDTEFVLDDQNQILIHTKYPSLGYLGYDNFVWQDGKQWYPTGDIGEIKDGLLFVQGRVDDQIKVNGVRVHLSDVNTHLAAIEGVTQSVVLQDCRSKIIGFYTGSLQKSLVYDQLKNKLYQPILPNQIYHLEQMPRTASGKIDRQALLSYANQQTIDVQDDDILYQIWRKVTGYQGAITRNDSFFELGGDSLDIAYFAIELERATGKKIDYWSVYEHPVIQDFCHWLNQQPKHTSEDAQLFQDAQSFDVPIVSYPFTPQQKRYKNIYMPMYNRNWCNMLVLWDFSRVDIQQLQDALIAVIARHDALQSYCLDEKMHLVPEDVYQNHKITQVVCSDGDFENTLNQVRLMQASRVIDIQTWPLFSMTLVQSPSYQMVVWNIHHLICDGYSQGLIKQELIECLNGKTPSIKPLQYSRYSLNHCGTSDSSLQYWQNLYQRPYKKINVATQYPDFNAKGFQSILLLDVDLSKKLKLFAQKMQCTPFTVILASYFLCLHEQYQVNDVVVGTPALGRMTIYEEEVIGNFISLVTVRSFLNGVLERNTKCYLEYVHNGLYQAMKYQDLQYDELVKMQNCHFDQDRFPLTTFFISLLNKKSEKLSMKTDGILHQDLGFDVKFDMMLYIDAYQDEFLLRMQYRRSLFDANDVQYFMKNIVLKITQMINGERVCGLL